MASKLKNFVTKLHLKTKRNYLKRMNNKKIECMKVAKKFGKSYWDGHRKFGYGGYRYIPGRWKKVAENLIKTYNLNENSKVLDVGCGKGFLLYEMKKVLPNLKVTGFDISKYSIQNSKTEVRKSLFIHSAEEKFPFEKNKFDLVISLGVLHNLSLEKVSSSLKEIQRVGKQSYIMVESYRNEKELFNLECWALTCRTFLNKSDWKWFFKKNSFFGDYEFIYFS